MAQRTVPVKMAETSMEKHIAAIVGVAVDSITLLLDASSESDCVAIPVYVILNEVKNLVARR